MKRKKLILTTLALLLGGVGQARAGFVDFTSGVLDTPTPDIATFGWKFTVTAPTTVTALGIWDDNSSPVTGDHLVGLWAFGSSLLALADVGPSDTPVASASAQGHWLFANIATNLMLAPGDYVLGEDYPSGDTALRLQVTGLTTPAGITNDMGLIGTGPGLNMPNQDIGSQPGYFGPNLETLEPTSVVPEPSTLTLLVISAVCSLRNGWRRRRQSS